ncbi:MAG: delta-60 repeat domain-containing protein, partial [Candidatus Udaeobacter sp.]
MKKKAAAQFVRRLAREDSLLAKTFGVRSSFGEGGSLITALYALVVALLVCLPSTSRAQLVDSFDPNANNDVRAFAVQADGKILVGGFFTRMGGQTRNRIALLNPDGSLDATFDPNANFFVEALAMQADGKILVGGLFTSIGGQTRNRIARLNSDGSLDASFDPNANDFVFAVAVQVDGKILVGGAFQFIGGQPRNRIARLNP